MKKVLITLFVCSSFLGLKAQGEPTCYQKYAKVFEVRGAKEVKDGNHEVVVTLRKGSFADCFVGKVRVTNSVIDKGSIKLSFVDGSFEPFQREYKFDDPITIVNGMSKTMVTKDEELVNVMFTDAIKPKKKALKRAPEPDFDL
ncbi:MAG: hypothetical protein RIC95_08075 [Vicingaceae bacterium]